MSMMIEGFRPLLAAAVETDDQLVNMKYPMVASPKVDGIRVLIHPVHGPVTRSMKKVRSRVVNSTLRQDPDIMFLDGEVVAGPLTAPNVFNRTSQCVMAEDGQDDFTYWVFDHWMNPVQNYQDRWMHHTALPLQANGGGGGGGLWTVNPRVKVLPWRLVRDPEEVLEAEQQWLGEGFEGIMLRDPGKPYKFNRSTLKEQVLLKLKRWADGEAVIVRVERRMRNQNEQQRDAFGLARRSASQAGQVADNACGRLWVKDCSGRFGEFGIGSGFDESTRLDLWDRRDQIVGKRVTYKYQPIGVVDAPRFPIFRGFRPEE